MMRTRRESPVTSLRATQGELGRWARRSLPFRTRQCCANQGPMDRTLLEIDFFFGFRRLDIGRLGSHVLFL